MILDIIKLILIFITAYLIGSIPTGFIIVKKLKNIDIRQMGSGSTGATNVKRILGTKWFFIVMLIDALKGALPVILTMKFIYIYSFNNDIAPVIAGAGAVIGHCKSIFLGFTGGKSVATTLGSIIALNPIVGAISVVVWAIITFASKYVSLGSVIAVTIVPVLMNYLEPSNYYNIIYASSCAVIVIILHQTNIKRLISGKENKVRK